MLSRWCDSEDFNPTPGPWARLTTAALAALTLASCAGESPGGLDLSSRARVTERQQERFLTLFEGAPAPPRLEESDYAARWAALKPGDRKRFRDLVDEDETLLGYFVADLDGDGRSDWIWDRTLSMFIPYDQDFDNDGDTNLLDPAPYNSTVGAEDADGDSIPDHLDFDRLEDADAALIELQERIHEDTGILVLNQDSRHDEASLKLFHEQATAVFGTLLSRHGGSLPTVRFLGASAATGGRVHSAWYNRENSMISLDDSFRRSDQLPYYYESTLVHEMAHALDDYVRFHTTHNVVRLEFLNHFWREDGFRGRGFEPRPAEAWHERITENFRSHPPEEEEAGRLRHPMNAPLARRNHVLSFYSLHNPNEYFAVAVEAYVFQVKLEKMAAAIEEEGARKIARRRMVNDYLFQTQIQPYNLPPEGFTLIDRLLGLRERLQWTPEPEASTQASGPMPHIGRPVPGTWANQAPRR